MSWLLLLLGFAVLVVGGELLVRGATALSGRMGIPPMVVGLTVVAIGSSMPELAVGIDAVFRDSPGLVTGNIVGTNIVNLLLILGLTAVLHPVLISRQMLRLDLPVVAGVAVLLFVLSLGGSLARPAGMVLVVVGVVYTWLILRHTRRVRGREPVPEASGASDQEATLPLPDVGDSLPADTAASRRGQLLRDIGYLVGGIVLVIIGADRLVTGAVEIATELGVSDTLIGLTIVAVGTSAPELVTAMVATVRGQASMAIGNLIGSSVYNIVFILGLTVLVAPSAVPVPDEVLYVDMLVMTGVSALVVAMCRSGHRITRREGGVLVLLYVAYLAYLVIART
ncbi:calcium/sodium antiporter [Corynebacterium terpenotabidum]|uniref:Na+/Ca+ antiporter, CaCA family protein n=1 Tax=Corynebacterium terpenotabidum Y-11 TaxID=1200352 RepID=S4XJB2_9CORY|nr:calcium/sodium antiporter [Corynebacterium terpenotabidum]AGP31840.1 Na+/Ca+ antiporter, CaCA family protein [Corynebacterium terpenotabidum Y-11]